MLISHRKKFIYTKTVKTAGTSVESYFEKYCMPEGEWQFINKRDQYVSGSGVIGARGADVSRFDWYNHMPASGIRDKIGIDDWENYFKFCVVRNPFDKLVSLFFFNKEKGALGIEETGGTVECFRAWISKGVPVPDRRQYLIKGRVCIDYFIRYENLAHGIKSVCDHLGLAFEPQNIPSLKSGFRDQSIEVREFYSEDMVQLVCKAYEFELKEFGYTFPS